MEKRYYYKRARKLLVFLLLFIFSFIVLSPTPLINAQREKSVSADLDPLFRIFNIEEIGAHYIIAIDTSLSMKDSFDEVKEALGVLKETIKDADTVSIITFDNKPRTIFRGNLDGSEDDFDQILPRQPNKDGKNTDIGSALSSVNEEIKQDREVLKFVFFLTDGSDEPPDSSPFKEDRDASWEHLKNEAAEFKSGDVEVKGIGLNKKTDIELLKKVFPTSSQLELSPAELKDYFSSLKDEIRLKRLKSELGDELREGRVLIEPVGSESWGEIGSETKILKKYRITSTYDHLPVEIELAQPEITLLNPEDDLEISKKDFKLRITGDQSFILKPGDSRIFNVEARGPKLERSKIIGLSRNDFNGNLSIDVKAILQPENGITKLEMPAKASIRGDRSKISFYRLDGFPITTLTFYLLLGLLFTGVLVRTVFIPMGRRISRLVFLPPLGGRLVFTRVPEGEHKPGPISLHSYGKRTVLGSRGEIVLKGERIKEAHAELYSKWVAKKPRVFIHKLDGETRVAKNSIEGGKSVIDEMELKEGDVIEIGHYRIQWL